MKLLRVMGAFAALLMVPSMAAGQVPKDAVSARLASCDSVLHAATFQGTMEAFAEGQGLQMRFTLQSWSPDMKKWSRVGAPGTFEQWLTAAAGNTRYVYDKAVDNLPVGTAYRVVVRFRFKNAAGEVVAKTSRHTKKCRQPDLRANLVPTKLRGGPVDAAGNRTYEVTMLNAGRSMSGPTAIALDVNGARAPLVVDPGLAPDASATLSFQAPACPAGSNVVATVDVNSEVDERDETDNSLTVTCPAERRNAR